MSTPKIVSINPSSFRDDSLVDLSLEEVVNRLKVEERMRRDTNEELGERPVSISFRSRPAGLEMSIDELHEALNVGEQVLTRCMCRHAEAWLRSLELVSVITSVYKIVRQAADGRVDIETKLKHGDTFNFITNIPVGGSNVSGVSSYSAVGWVRSYFNEIADPLGVPAYRLPLIGHCWSITTNTSGLREQSIKQYLDPEVARFKQHLKGRLKYLAYLSDVINDPSM